MELYLVRNVFTAELYFSIWPTVARNSAALIRSWPTRMPPAIRPMITSTIETSIRVKPDRYCETWADPPMYCLHAFHNTALQIQRIPAAGGNLLPLPATSYPIPPLGSIVFSTIYEVPIPI